MKRLIQSPQLGVTPTNSQKLIYISQKLGLTGIKGMQGSTVNIFDTVPLITNADRQTLSFFSQTSNKSRNFTNFQNGTLNAGEAMIVEDLSFYLITTTNADLTSNANAILTAAPITATSATAYPNRSGFLSGLINVTIANSRVVKDLNGYEQTPVFNTKATGIAVTDSAIATERVIGASKIYLESPPVLPPNQKINVTIEIAPTGTIPANTFIVCVAGRFGSIFAAKTTL